MLSVRSLCVATVATLVTTACVLDREGQLNLNPGVGGSAAGGGMAGGMGGSPPTMTVQGGSGGVLDPAPGPVDNLTAVVDGVVTVTWNNPTDSDLESILVVHRAAQPVSFSPVDGTTYDAGNPVMTGQDAIFSELGETATLSPAVPGLEHHFAAWARDAGGNYSAIQLTSGLNNSLGTQTAQIEVSLVDGAVTINQQPENFPLTGSATYASGPNTLTVTLSASNDTARMVFNLKGMLSNQNDGDFIQPTLPPGGGGGTPYVYFGPRGLDVGEARSSDIAIDNVDGQTDPVTFEVSFVDAPWLIGLDRINGATRTDTALLLVDSSGASSQPTVAVTPNASSTVHYRSVAVSKDGRRAFVGSKSSPSMTAIDLGTLSNIVGADLGAGAVGTVSGVALSPDGERLFAALTLGAHHSGAIGDQSSDKATVTDVVLVELAPDTLVETQRIAIHMADTSRRMTRTMAVSHDGNMAAIVVRHPLNSGIDAEIYFFDLTTFAPVDADAGTSPIDPVFIVNDIRPDQLLYNSDDSLLYVATGFLGEVEVIDLSNFTTSTLIPASPMRRANGLWLLDDALLVSGDDRRNDTSGTPLTSFSFANNAETSIDTGLGEAMRIVGNDTRYYVYGRSEIAVFDRATNSRIDMDGNALNGITNLRLRAAVSLAAHFGAITPF